MLSIYKPRHTRHSFLAIIFTICCLAGCSTTNTPSIEKSSAIAWVKSREGAASSRQAYYLAENSLSKLEHTNSGIRLAIVMDLDETVLDNSDFQMSLITHSQPYTETAFLNWAKMGSASAIPGSAEFIKKAQTSGFTVFFVTNRTASIKSATKTNLTNIGVNLEGDVDTVLCLGDKPDWGKDKKSRWNYIESKYTIAMYIGDSIYDFPINTITNKDTNKPDNDHWGRDWILISNPMYGSWQ